MTHQIGSIDWVWHNKEMGDDMPTRNTNASADLTDQIDDELSAVVDGWGTSEVVLPMVWKSIPEPANPEAAPVSGDQANAVVQSTAAPAEVIDLATGITLSGHRDGLVLQEIERLYGPDTIDVLTLNPDAPTDASCGEDRLIACIGDS